MALAIIKEVKDLNRFREILVVLFEEGFDVIIDAVQLKHHIPLSKRIHLPALKKQSIPNEVKLRKTLERLGPTFIKFGQMLSVRADLLPKHYCDELSKLQDHVPAMAFDTVKEIVEQELGKKIPNIFSSFETAPVASASISQVHKAVLKDGSVVAVKVKRPNAEEIMERDMEIMFYIARLLEKHFPHIKKYEPVSIIEEFKRWTEKECDFKREALNARRFAHNCRHDRYVKIPSIYKHLTTSSLLTMEFIEGTPLHDMAALKKRKVNLSQLMQRGFEAILEQVFVHGFFHADPHPGNIIITKKHQIAFVDFGIVGRFDDAMKRLSFLLFEGTVSNNAEQVVDAIQAMAKQPLRDRAEFQDEIAEILDGLQEDNLKKIKISKVLEEIFAASLNHGIRVPMEFVLFGKTVVTLEGVALEYDPSFNIVQNSTPFIKKMIKDQYRPSRIIKDSWQKLTGMRGYAERLPMQVSRALQRIEEGSFRVDIEDTDIQKLSLEIDRSSNRVAYSMLITALLIVGALTISFGSPIAFALPLLPLLSFSAAIIMIVTLFWSILQEKRKII